MKRTTQRRTTVHTTYAVTFTVDDLVSRLAPEADGEISSIGWDEVEDELTITWSKEGTLTEELP